MHLDEFEQNEENIKHEIFSNENTSLKNYGAIYKDQNSEKFILSDKKIEGKVLLAECYFHKIINSKGYFNHNVDGINFLLILLKKLNHINKHTLLDILRVE